jgi:methionine-rich copper-binding protein CopC
MKAFRHLGMRNFAVPKRTLRPKFITIGIEALEDRLAPAGNPIIAENLLPGSPASEWDIVGNGDSSIQGFATDMSINHGQAIQFKINDSALAPYHIDIYRVGYYGGLGARKVDTIAASQTLRQNQPAPLFDPATRLVDAGNWTTSATWTAPATAVSGVYIARLVREDTGGANHILFVVRDDEGESDILFQTSDTTWQAYNDWGGWSLYGGTDGRRAYKISYNRPFLRNTTVNGRDFFFGVEYAQVRWLEANGYHVSYFSEMDTDRRGAELREHQVFMSVGHDEYWSGPQRANVEAARDAGVNLAFFSGNEVYWRTRWETSIDGSGTTFRTLVCYKETHANNILDPTNEWTGTWRDPRFTPPKIGGGNPENGLSGQIFMVDRGPGGNTGTSFQVPSQFADLRFWRNTAVAALQPGQVATLGDQVLGYEWDEDLDNGFRPAGLVPLSVTTQDVPEYLLDYGTSVGPGTATHRLTMYRADSGALVFGAGTVQWAWGLDGTHDGPKTKPDPAMQQATVNLLADMGVQPGSLPVSLMPAFMSADVSAPVSVFTNLADGDRLTAGTPVILRGTATDSGGGTVAAVEISVDGGRTWHRATGRAAWTYSWTPSQIGPVEVRARAVDDNYNLETPAVVTVTVKPTPTDPTGLVAAYGFEANSGTTVLDSSGLGNHGSFGGFSSPAWVAGKFGQGLFFDGGDMVTVPDSASLDLTQGMTLSAWVNPGFGGISLGSDLRTVVLKEQPQGLAYALYGFHGNGKPPATFIAQKTSINGLEGSTTLPLNTWSYLTATYDNTTLRLYVNGQLVGSQNYPGGMTPSDNPLRIGGDTIWGEYFFGIIDEVRIYNRPLKLAEIATDMSTSVAGTMDAEPPTATITGPFDGTTVSGLVQVAANASDNIAVAAVQLFVDGEAVGPEQTVLPYLLPWNTLGFTNGRHTLTVRARDLVGNFAFSSPVNVTVSNAPDTQPPTVQLLYPRPGQRVGGLTPVNILASDNLRLRNVTLLVDGTPAGSPDQTTPYRIAWDTTAFTDGSHTLAARARDAAGNVTDSTPITVFVDNTPPTVVSFTPGDGTTDVSTGSLVTATFDTPVWSQTAVFELHAANGAAVPAKVTYDPATNTLTLKPLQALNIATQYTATVSGVRDITGNPMTQPYSWSFTTVGAVVQSIWDDSVLPDVAAANDPNPVEVGLKFKSGKAGYITALQFYKGAGNTGTHVGHLWTAGGTLLASVTFTHETASGWQQASLSAPVPIAADTTYVISYYAPNGHYAFSGSYFQNTGTDNGFLHALSSPASGGNGVFRYGIGGGFPTQSFNASNYWVDLVFVASATDTLPPVVTAVTPADKARGVSLNNPVTATFDEAITLASLTFQLRDADGNQVSASLNYDNATHQATLTPTAPLDKGKTYTASVSASDLAGNAMTSPFTWSCTTISETFSLWTDADSPAVATAADTAAIEVGVKFHTESAGYIKAIRFYKGAGNTGTHVGHLWAEGGNLLATVTFSGESASGWQEMDLPWQVPVTANTTYIVSYYAPHGGYAYTYHYFDSAHKNGPLEAYSNSASGGNGVYLYAVGGGNPTQSYNATNYWVDVVFTTDATDTTPPTVVNTSPTDGTTQVGVGTKVTATFSEPINPATLAFLLKDANGNQVSATVSYDNATLKATLTPTPPLNLGVTYTASVSASDLAGNAMASPFTWSFTTGVVTQSLWSDAATPAVETATDTAPIEVGVRFQSDIDGYIKAIRFYKGTGNTGLHVGHLWDAAGHLLASVNFTSETVTGWQQAQLSTPVAVTANTTYIVSYYAPHGGYSYTYNYFGSGWNNDHLHALANGDGGGNGVYRYGTGGGFPTQSFNATNYWADVVFSNYLD